MIEARQDRDLTPEPLGACRAGEFDAQDLQRDLAVVSQIDRTVDDSPSAHAKHVAHPIPLGDYCWCAVRSLAHRLRWPE